MKTIYYISGLGADERVFRYLDIKGVSEVYIKWEVPFKNEKLSEYCKRLLTQIDLSEEVILVGVSFGGIVAQEIAKLITVNKLIIISSVKSPAEFDWQLSLVRKLKLNRLVPARLLKWSNLLTGDYYFSVKNKAESDLLTQIIKDTDLHFMKWAIEAIMQWNSENTGQNVVHIHGDSDRIFPVKNIKNAIIISGGGHFMIVNRAKEITTLIQAYIM